MKFVSLIFLLEIILLVNVTAGPHKSSVNFYRPMTDTIIKLDSVKDQKLIKGKKSKTNQRTKNAAAVTTANDTTKKKKEGLQSEITTHAEDSIKYSDDHQIIYLYGRARVTYEDVELDADYIRVDQKKHLLFAKGSTDPITKRYVGRPISKQKNDKPIESDSLLFDYKTKKGRLYNPASDQDGNFISGGDMKKLNETEIAYHNVLFSTCDLPYPDTHFGIVITKGIAEKNRIISGPAYLEIEGVPLPFAIPFGFFPKPNKRTSGVILPTFGEDQKLGFYLRGFGYYFGISDYMDLTTTGTVFSKGSFELNATSTYRKRYKYTGSVSFSYGSHNYGLPGDKPTKDFAINWTHSQDPNAHPGSTFSASVDATTSTYYRNDPTATNYNIAALTHSNSQSSINYSKSWNGKIPINLSAGVALSQDLSTQTISQFQLPTISLSMASLSPFDSQDRVGEQKWYQKITMSYSLAASNEVDNIPESQLFKGNTLSKDLQTHIVHTIPISLSLNVLKYFQFNSSVNYTEHWYLQTIRKNIGRGSVSGTDTTIIDTVKGFRRAGSYNLSSGFSTKVYSTISFKKGDLQAIRHVMTPQLSFSYTPDFADPSHGYYKRAISNATVPYPYTSQLYSIFQDGFPSPGKSAGLQFSLDNTIEAKVKAKATDTSGKARKISILQGLSFSTFYNFAADSMRLSPISFSGHTAIFHEKVNVSFFGSLNPYVTQALDSISGGRIQRFARPINRYTFQDGRFPTLTSFSVSMSGSLNPATFNPRTPPVVLPGANLQNVNSQQAQRLALINSDPSAYVDFNVPWNLSFNYSFSYQNNTINTTTANTMMLNGDINITSKWKVQYSTNYDIRARKLALSSFTIYRDLHCWDLNVQWVPFGPYKSYNITLKVKATILQDLKLSKRSDYTSNSSFGSSLGSSLGQFNQ